MSGPRQAEGERLHLAGEADQRWQQRLDPLQRRLAGGCHLSRDIPGLIGAAGLEVSVLDTLYNGKHLAVVDSSIEAHMLDLLIYRLNAKMAPCDGEHTYMVCGKSCLAGDIFGEYQFDRPLAIGDRLSFIDTAGYTMVKKNWFNGLKMPSIVVKQLDGTVEVVREFGYEDYLSSLS